MFGGLKDFANLMKSMGQMKERMGQLQEDLERRTVEAESGAGAVRVTLNGKGRVLRLHLDPALLAGLAGDDRAMVEDLIASAFNAAMEKVQELMMDEFGKISGGMNLPGLMGPG